MYEQTRKGIPLIVLPIILLFMMSAMSQAEAVPAGPADTAGIGVVDYTFLINQYPDTPRANELLQTESDRLNREYSLQSANLSYAELQQRNQQLQRQLEQKRLELIGPIAAKVRAAAEAVSREQGLSIVLPKSALVCGGRDITFDVLLRLSDYRGDLRRNETVQ